MQAIAGLQRCLLLLPSIETVGNHDFLQVVLFEGMSAVAEDELVDAEGALHINARHKAEIQICNLLGLQARRDGIEGPT